MLISVSEPVKQGEGLSGYISYKINTETSWPCFNQREFSVIRRYNDFLWLHQHLCQDFPGLVVPPLPEKQNLGESGESHWLSLTARVPPCRALRGRICGEPQACT